MQDAVNDAQDGDTIILLGDEAPTDFSRSFFGYGGIALIDDKELTIDGNGKTLSVRNFVEPDYPYIHAGIIIQNNSNITIKKLTIDSAASDPDAIPTYGMQIIQSTVTLDSVTIQNHYQGAMQVIETELTINGLITQNNGTYEQEIFVQNVLGKEPMGDSNIVINNTNIYEECSLILAESKELASIREPGNIVVTINGGVYKYIDTFESSPYCNPPEVIINGGTFATSTSEGYSDISQFLADGLLWDPVTGVVSKEGVIDPEPTPDPSPYDLLFNDVTTSEWYYEPVKYVFDNGLMTGVGGNSFAPNITTTRGMIVSILYRLEGSPAADSTTFNDVNDSDWYGPAAAWVAENGIVNGYTDTQFAPNDPITREQMAAILYNYSAYKNLPTEARADLTNYNDVNSISDWAIEVFAWANAEGLISGMTADTLVPQGNAVRSQSAAILQRYIESNALI